VIEIGVIKYNERVLPTQLQNYRSEVFGSARHDKLPYGRGANKKNFLHARLDQGGSCITEPSDNLDQIRVVASAGYHAAQLVFDDVGAQWGDFRRLQNDTIATKDGGDDVEIMFWKG